MFGGSAEIWSGKEQCGERGKQWLISSLRYAVQKTPQLLTCVLDKQGQMGIVGNCCPILRGVEVGKGLSCNACTDQSVI